MVWSAGLNPVLEGGFAPFRNQAEMDKRRRIGDETARSGPEFEPNRVREPTTSPTDPQREKRGRNPAASKASDTLLSGAKVYSTVIGRVVGLGRR